MCHVLLLLSIQNEKYAYRHDIEIRQMFYVEVQSAVSLPALDGERPSHLPSLNVFRCLHRTLLLLG